MRPIQTILAGTCLLLALVQLQQQIGAGAQEAATAEIPASDEDGTTAATTGDDGTSSSEEENKPRKQGGFKGEMGKGHGCWGGAGNDHNSKMPGKFGSGDKMVPVPPHLMGGKGKPTMPFGNAKPGQVGSMGGFGGKPPGGPMGGSGFGGKPPGPMGGPGGKLQGFGDKQVMGGPRAMGGAPFQKPSQ